MESAAFHLQPDEVERARAGRLEENELADMLVARGVAPDAAVGWAVHTRGGWVSGAGRASAEGATTSAEAIFDLASVTKPMTAFAFARCGMARALPLGEVLSEAVSTASADVPLELLLAHRAGLEGHLPIYDSVAQGGRLDREAAMRRIAEGRRDDAAGPVPAEGFAPVYSDLGYALVGEALARATKARDAGEAIERLVATPLGRSDLGTARALRGAGIDFASRVRPTEVATWRGGEVRGAVHDENAWVLTGDGGSGHAGMFGAASAVLAFGCAVFDAIERGEGPLATPGSELGWLVRPRPGGTLRAGFDGKSENGSSAGELAGPRAYGHLGFTGTSLWIDPDARAVVVVLTNRVCPSRDNIAIRVARPFVHDALFALARRHCI